MNTNKMFTAGEIVTIKTNLHEIEKHLGHPIPGGLVDVSELKDHVLRGGELVTVCRNIKEITGPKSYVKRPRYTSNNSDTSIELIIFILYFVIGGLVMLFK